jgi:hypothetical protein
VENDAEIGIAFALSFVMVGEGRPSTVFVPLKETRGCSAAAQRAAFN